MTGAPGPFSFTVVLRRDDRLVNCVFPLGCEFTHGSVPGEEPAPIDDLDDLIGRHTVVYSMYERTALQVGQVVEESIWLRPYTSTDATVFSCSSWEAEHQFTWRLTRLPDAEPVVGPVTLPA